MGVHFGNATLIGDGELDPDRSELLVYEPKNGQLHLVAAAVASSTHLTFGIVPQLPVASHAREALSR